MRRESKQRRVRERTATGRGMSGSYLEPDREGYDDSEEEGGISLSAIKNKYKRGARGKITLNKQFFKLYSQILFLLQMHAHPSTLLKTMHPILKIVKWRNRKDPKLCKTRMMTTKLAEAEQPKSGWFPAVMTTIATNFFFLLCPWLNREIL